MASLHHPSGARRHRTVPASELVLDGWQGQLEDASVAAADVVPSVAPREPGQPERRWIDGMMGYPAADPGANVTSATTIGELIRELRLSRGFSLGQLATQLGLAPAVVRKWERGEDAPAPEFFSDLATALDVDPAGIAALHIAPEVSGPDASSPEVNAPEDPTFEEPDTRGQEPVAGEADVPDLVEETSAPKIEAARSAPAMLATDDEYSDAGATTASVVADVGGATGSDVSATGTLAGATERDQIPAPVSFDHVGPISVVESGITEAPTEAIAAPVAPLAAARFEQVTVVEHIAGTGRRRRIPNPLEIFFDPARRWLYWIRYALTIVVLLILLRVLLWAGGELWSALGELLDTFSSTDEAEETLRALVAV